MGAVSRGVKRAAIAAAFLVVVTGSARAELTHLWHYEGQVNGTNWRTVAIGASGSQVVSNPNGGSGAVALLAGSEVPSSPLIWSDNTAATARTGLVRAAAESDKYASLYFESTGSAGTQFIPKLSLRRSTSATALWTKTFNAMTAMPESLSAGVHVSADGTRILAWWYDTAQAKTYFVGYSDAGAVNFAVVANTQTPTEAAATNYDATRLFIVLSNLTMVVDGTNGAILQVLQGWYNPTGAFATNRAGTCIANGTVSGAVDVYRTAGSSFAGAISIPGVTSLQPRKAALSGDGSTLAVAYRSLVNLSSWTVRVYTLGATSATLMHESSFTGGGAYTTLVTDVAQSSAGDVVAVCTTGDQNHTLPSILVYKRNGSTFAQSGSFVLPGSAYDIDLSPDGRLLAVASSLSHYQASTNTGVVDAFDLGGDLHVTGVPHAGTHVLVEQQALPGRPCMLLMSDTLAVTPVTYVGMGTLLLHSPVRVATATADAAGVARFDFSVPSGAQEWGHTYYTQAMTLIDRKLTESYVPITVVP